MKIRPVGAELFKADRSADIHDEAHWHVQKATIPSHSQELLPFLPVNLLAPEFGI
jgi:hypothetical protein